MDEEIGKLPPQAIDIEEALLGMLMTDSSVYDKVNGVISADMFYSEASKKIFRAIEELEMDGITPDVLSIKKQLDKKGETEEVGGAYRLASLSDVHDIGADVVFYAKVIAEKYYRREMIRLSHELNRDSFDESIDLADLIESLYGGYDMITSSINRSDNTQRTMAEVMEDSYRQAVERKAAREENRAIGISTMIDELDKKIGGWQDSDLIIIAGRPGMGKTAFALTTMYNAAKSGKWINIFSLEMSDVRLADRVLCGLSGVDTKRFRDGYLNAEEIAKLEKVKERLKKLPVYIDSKPIVTIDYIHSIGRLNKKRGRCDMIIIDYLQLIHTEKKRQREVEVSDISRRAKLMAKDLNIPVILLAQLNRQCELRGGSKRPILSDLRESGSIEQDADLVLFLYRAENYDIMEDDYGLTTGRGEIIIAKHRNGSTGKVFFGYNESLTRIYNYGMVDTEPDEILPF